MASLEDDVSPTTIGFLMGTSFVLEHLKGDISKFQKRSCFNSNRPCYRGIYDVANEACSKMINLHVYHYIIVFILTHTYGIHVELSTVLLLEATSIRCSVPTPQSNSERVLTTTSLWTRRCPRNMDLHQNGLGPLWAPIVHDDLRTACWGREIIGHWPHLLKTL